jgi:hypothetical protein
LGLLVAVATALGAYAYPAIAATVCPSCYGLERIGSTLIVDSEMPPATRERLRADAMSAEAAVRSFYGTFERRPILVACSTDRCDRRMGGHGARGTTLSMPFATVIRLSPLGLDPTILAHEFSHVELHRRIGVWKLIRGAVPAWFDEGVAVIVSNDGRYLKAGVSAPDRCVRTAASPLPARVSEWRTQAGKDPMIYADAACGVLRWMDVNGGKDGLVRAIGDIADGGSLRL